jgi:protein-disulfide isomerase-like protein with CxxC motif
VLAQRLQVLADSGDPRAVERLAPYLAALRDGAKPWSVLNWMTVSAGYRTLLELTRGELELSHEGLETVARGQSTAYLRAALIRAGVLPARHEQAAKLDAFIRAQAAHLPEGEDRTQLRAFAVWQIEHDLKRREGRGQATRSSHKLARSQISVAGELITWLHAHGMTLRDLRQEHLDRWLADGSTHRRRIRAFLA